MIVSRIAQAALALLGALPAINAQMLVKPASKRATVCNGYSELCSRTYGNVTYIGAHNSYAVGSNNLAANQDYDVTQQLKDGIRLLQLQAHNQNGVINLCHSTCLLLNGGTLTDYLKKVKSWMDSNPNEVVTILIVNINNLPASQFASSYEAAGIVDMSYAPETASVKADAWPTLGTLIDTGKRLVTFMDNSADATAAPYIIDEFTNIWETAFDVTDTAFPCTLNRTAGTADGKMGLSNHFLDTYASLFGVQSLVPDKESLNQTNAVSGVGSLGQEAETCIAANGRQQTFFLVDYYNYGLGSVFQVAATANGVTYDTTKTIAPPITSTDGSSSSGNSTTHGNSAVALSSISWQAGWTSALFLGSVAFGGFVAL